MSITIPVVLSGGGDKCDENIPATHWGSDNPVEEAIALLHLIYYRQHILYQAFPCASTGVPVIWRDIYAVNCIIIPSVYNRVALFWKIIATFAARDTLLLISHIIFSIIEISFYDRRWNFALLLSRNRRDELAKLFNYKSLTLSRNERSKVPNDINLYRNPTWKRKSRFFIFFWMICCRKCKLLSLSLFSISYFIYALCTYRASNELSWRSLGTVTNVDTLLLLALLNLYLALPQSLSHHDFPSKDVVAFYCICLLLTGFVCIFIYAIQLFPSFVSLPHSGIFIRHDRHERTVINSPLSRYAFSEANNGGFSWGFPT